MPTKTFTYTGEWERWDVPNNVEVVTVEINGGGSGDRQGGRVTGNIRVKDEKALLVAVGRRGWQADGDIGGAQAFGGGGAGGRAGSPSRDGGDGGGGASIVRLNNRDGLIRGVAGGAGGDSGDGSTGGRGGNNVGQDGSHSADVTSVDVGNATGGTQNQGGKGGTQRGYPGLWGTDAEQARLGRGGRGGQGSLAASHGGGGGGGGWHAGGGGAGSVIGEAPGGGGGGGSNYIGGMFGAQSFRGTGGTGHGTITFTWDTTNPPIPPDNITINGEPLGDETPTKATNSVVVRGTPDDPDSVRGVRMLIWMSKDPSFVNHRTFKGTYDEPEARDKATLTPLEQDTLYYLRFYTQDINGNVSSNYKARSFWTNRRPEQPTLVSPAENAQVQTILNTTFQWHHNDADPDDPQQAWHLRYRVMATPLADAGEWQYREGTGSTETWVIDAGTFKGNSFYEWGVKTQDQQDRWSEWSFSRSFFVLSDTTPPQLYAPVRDEAVIAGLPSTFRWKFLSPGRQVGQSRADFRYRVMGATDWTTMFGDPVTPGQDKFWVFPAETWAPGVQYQWQVRTYDTDDVDSDWSDSSSFWGAATPGTGAGLDPIFSTDPAPPLGQGINRAMVFDRGGEVLRGELTPLADITWHRKRDDIATNVLHMTEWDEDMVGLLRALRCWRHEIVVFREVNGRSERVAEGPITRISTRRGGIEVEFRDPLAYVYRRIMRQGYNDSYRIIDGQQVGLTPVTTRAKQIILNALAYDDPNVLPYLTAFEYADDARCSRVRKDFTCTAWEEVDDLAAHGGLDYVTSGRRVILWDTHRPIGRLPEMGGESFSEWPVLTEYGAAMANVFAVTNNGGLYGVATRGLEADGTPKGGVGFVEQLASSYGETEGAGTERTLTREARKQAEQKLREQAQRNIAGRYSESGPSPRVVRIPDNATLVPTLSIGINQLIPGVWIPLRIDDGIQELSQWQKLDSVTVQQDARGERISVVMSPAPNDGADPDADQAAEAEA